MIWTKEMDDTLRFLYPTHTNHEISDLTGWTYYAIGGRAKNLNLRKDLATKQRSGGITPWTDDQIKFIQDNYLLLTNRELANALGYKLTVVRIKKAELGLKRIRMEYWSNEMTQFLIDNYKTLGDVEIMNHFIKYHPKKKAWTRSHINKKRRQLNLHRTPEEIEVIVSRNVSAGGPSYTIDRNSSSKNMHDNWVAGLIAWRNPALRKEVLKHPDLIKLKREQIKLSRAIKEVKNGR